MSTLKELLVEMADRARATGRAVTIDPPMTRREINDLATRCGALPPAIRELVEFTGGVSVDDIVVRLLGDYSFEFEEMFVCSVPITTDGAGNFWVVDVAPNGTWRSVFFIAHDPPVAVLQARDVGAFIEQVFERAESKLLNHEAVMRIWKDNPHAIPRSQARTSNDAVLRAFAEQLDDRFAIVDLRAGVPGTGFVWGAAGADTELRRAGDELLFAVERKK